MVYVIEEELYSDSDRSSVYTSEDEFDIVKKIPKTFKKAFPLMNKKVAMREQERRKELDQIDSEDNNSVRSKKWQNSWPQDMIEVHCHPVVRDKNFLTSAQKEYQNKLLPKQYIEKMKDMRITKFKQQEFKTASKKLAKKKRKLRERL